MADEQQIFQMELTVRSDKATLRIGLRDWGILGLLTPDQIQEIESAYQIGLQPEPLKATQNPQEPIPETIPEAIPETIPEDLPPISEKRLDQVPPVLSFWASLGTELGVRWLLWIGLFLVVVSSGLLAASQWNRLAAVGQYGILWAYSLGFLGAAGWAKRQDSLRLTGETLELIALLLVPINGWAMSSLGIPSFLGVGAIGILGVSAHWLTRTWIPIGVMVNFALLSTVPLVWDWGPLGITYAGIGMTVLYGILRPLYSQDLKHLALLAMAESLLVLRGLLAGDLVISQLAVVLAWVTWEWSERRLKKTRLDESADDAAETSGNTENPDQHQPQKPWEWEWMLGILALSWILAGWDGIVISRLSIALLGIRVLSAWLAQTQRTVDLVLLFGVGIEAIWATWRVIPDPVQRLLLATVEVSLGWRGWPLLGITLLPYVALWLVLTERLRRDPQYSNGILTQTAECLALVLGAASLVASLWDPSLLALHLLLSAGILAIWLCFKPEPAQWQRVLTWGYLIGAGAAGILDWWLSWGILELLLSPKLWLWSWAGFSAGLMAVRAAVRKQTGPWIQALQVVLDLWGGILTVLMLGGMTLVHSSFPNASTYEWAQRVMGESCIALVLLTAALGIRLWTEGNSGSNLKRDGLIYALGWGCEGILVYGLGATGATPLEVASIAGAANLGLGILTWQVGDAALRMDPELYKKLSSLLVGPLILGLVGWIMLAINRDFAGLGSLGLSILLLGLGQRGHRWLRILGVTGFSLAAYEALIQFLFDLGGENVADGLALIGLLGLVLAFAYRYCPPEIRERLGLDRSVMRVLGHLNWGFANNLLILGLFVPMSQMGSHLWIGVGVSLVAYALWQSWQQQNPSSDIWSYAAALEIVGVGMMMIETWIPALAWPVWSGTLGCGLGIVYALLPWQRWGWRAEPWQQSSLILPGAGIVLTSLVVNQASVLVGAAYYGWLAFHRSHFRLGYISLVLSNWAIYHWVWWEVWYSLSLWVLPITVSVALVAQLDPDFNKSDTRSTRHWLRTLSVGLLCLAVWVETLGQLWGGFWPVLLGSLFMGSGLGWRVRAYLWMGSLSFGLGILRQAALLISRYPALLWGIGILVGLGLIWIAANVERRRPPAWWGTWNQDLQSWE